MFKTKITSNIRLILNCGLCERKSLNNRLVKRDIIFMDSKKVLNSIIKYGKNITNKNATISTNEYTEIRCTNYNIKIPPNNYDVFRRESIYNKDISSIILKPVKNKKYMETISDIANKNNILLVIDERNNKINELCKTWLHYNVNPDIIIFNVGNISGIITQSNISSNIEFVEHHKLL